MKYINLEIDFIKRTRLLIDQYTKLNNPEMEKFEVTLFVNCLTGLLVFPKEKGLLSRISEKPIEFLETLKIDLNHIIYKEFKNVQELVIQLRHCIAHFDINFSDEGTNEIKNIKFEDNKKGKGVIAEFTLEEVKTLVNYFTTDMIENYEKIKS